MKSITIRPGMRLLVRPLLSLRPVHKGTFDHMHKGGELVYLEDGARQHSRCTWADVLAVFTDEGDKYITRRIIE